MDGYVDLDLLSISLKDMQESWEEMGEGQAFQRQQWWGKDRKQAGKVRVSLEKNTP